MEQQPIQADSVQQQPMEVENASAETVIAKKQVSIVDTRLAIKPFKTCRDGLEAFVQACNRKKTGGSTPEMFGVFFKRVVMDKTLDPPQIHHLLRHYAEMQLEARAFSEYILIFLDKFLH